jgi:hypothetical protein
VSAGLVISALLLIALWVRAADIETNFQEPLLEIHDFAVYSMSWKKVRTILL